MATNLAIDPELLDHALAVSGVKTKKEAVTIALQEFIARRAQAELVESFGTLDWDDTYDYKEGRRPRDYMLLTTDKDFHLAARHIDLQVWQTPAR